jgi:hypothetical protein
MEAKLDAILMAVDTQHGDEAIKKIDDLYEGRHTDTGVTRHRAWLADRESKLG